MNYSKVFESIVLYTIVNKYQFTNNQDFFDKEINERVSLTLLYKEKDVFKTT